MCLFFYLCIFLKTVLLRSNWDIINWTLTRKFFWERNRVWVGEGQRERERENPRQALHWLGARTLEPWGHDLSQSRTLNRLSHWGAPDSFFVFDTWLYHLSKPTVDLLPASHSVLVNVLRGPRSVQASLSWLNASVEWRPFGHRIFHEAKRWRVHHRTLDEPWRQEVPGSLPGHSVLLMEGRLTSRVIV